VKIENRIIKELQLVESLLQIRIADNDRKFKDALDGQAWSHLSGLFGIGTGLLMAKNLIQEEIQILKKQK
jgi:hypothetical protein